MEHVIELTPLLTTLPQCWLWVDIEPVGARHSHLQCQRPADSHSLDQLIAQHVHAADDPVQERQEASDQENGEPSGELQLDDNAEYVRSLDPKQWLKQDHYRVLGLSQLRYRATDLQIRQAYRLMVLRHHPDKRAASSSDATGKTRKRSKTSTSAGKQGSGNNDDDDDDDYFTCITRAYETLSDRARRISYDSVDPTFDDTIPSERVAPEKFYKTFAPVFARNAHWSVRGHMPALGDDEASREHVEHFYSQWFGLESWREFTYDDEEGGGQDRAENRDERRYMEKQIRAVRKERKRAENARIRQLVETAHACDPRVLRFRQLDRQRKLDQKQRRAEERQRRAEAEQEALRLAERQSLERKEAESRAQREREAERRREQEARRRRLATGRQRVRRLCEEAEYYAEGEAERADHMLQLERLCAMLDAQQLEELAEQLDESRDSRLQQRQLYRQRVQLMQQTVQTESGGGGSASNDNSTAGATSHTQRSVEWSHDELQALIRAVRLFPAGTVRRWEVVANFISQHSSNGSTRSAKEVLEQAKQLQRSDQQLRSAASERPFVSKGGGSAGGAGAPPTTTPTDTLQPNGGISQRTETPMEQQGSNTSTWSGEEQRLLEQALKTYGAQTPARWDRIAECLPNRTKKDCMRRYKELVEIVKAKKAAQAAVSAAK